MHVLSTNDLEFWQEHGYVIVADAAPRENLQSVIDAIWAIPEDERVPDVITKGLVVGYGDIDIAIFVEVSGDAT